MRRLLLLLAPALIFLAACDLSAVPLHVSPNTGETVEWRDRDVRIQIDQSAEFVRTEVTQAAAKWNAAKYVNISVLPRGTPCPQGKVCPVVWGVAFTTPELRMGVGVCDVCRFHEDYGRMDMRVDTRWPPSLSRAWGIGHELGHMLSLEHGNVPGPYAQGYPTVWELALVDAIHDPADL